MLLFSFSYQSMCADSNECADMSTVLTMDRGAFDRIATDFNLRPSLVSGEELGEKNT